MTIEENREKRLSTLINEFENQKENYDKFEMCLSNLVNRIIEASGVVVHDISSRRKGRASYIEKIKKPGKIYASLTDVTDVVGLRVTTYFESDVDKIKKYIEQEFEIDDLNSVDKRRLHDPDRFGYMSLHYVISLKPDRIKHLEYKPFAGLKAEIQIRSILQHTWAEIEHDLGYKTKYAIPYYLKRRFSQLSSLLELADREFLELKNRIEEYDHRVLELLKKDKGEILIDKNSIIIISGHDELIVNLDKIVCKVTGARLTANNDYSENIANMLLWIGIERASELHTQIEIHSRLIQVFAYNWISQRSYSEFNHGVSLMYLCYLVLAEQQSVEKINEFAKGFSLGKHINDFGVHLLEVYKKTVEQLKQEQNHVHAPDTDKN